MSYKKFFFYGAFVLGVAVGGSSLVLYYNYWIPSPGYLPSLEFSPQSLGAQTSSSQLYKNSNCHLFFPCDRRNAVLPEHTENDAIGENSHEASMRSSKGVLGGEPASLVNVKNENLLNCNSFSSPLTSSTQATFSELCSPAAALGLPSHNAVRDCGGYIASLNYERRIPNWVLEVLDSESIKPLHNFNKDHPEHEKNLGLKKRKTTSSVNVDKKFYEKSGEKEEKAESHTPTPPQDVAPSRSHSRFFADPTVSETFRVDPRVYTSSGMRGISRGHLASAQYHTATQQELDSTFNMNANIVPQDMVLNALDWFRLESLGLKLARSLHGSSAENKGVRKEKQFEGRNAKLYVASGPLFLPQRSTNGFLEMKYHLLEARKPIYQIVAVPTHFFKVFVSERRESSSGKPEYAAAGFLLPNEPIPEERPLTDYKVPISNIEFYTGLHFFPSVNAATLPDLCTKLPCDAKGSGLFNSKFRPIAQLRSASSIPELRSRYHKILEDRQTKKTVGEDINSIIEKEFQIRLETLLASATASVDEA